MPIEIRELVIKVTVEEHQKVPDTGTPQSQHALKKGIIDECVAIVMAKLERQRER